MLFGFSGVSTGRCVFILVTRLSPKRDKVFSDTVHISITQLCPQKLLNAKLIPLMRCFRTFLIKKRSDLYHLKCFEIDWIIERTTSSALKKSYLDVSKSIAQWHAHT